MVNFTFVFCQKCELCLFIMLNVKLLLSILFSTLDDTDLNKILVIEAYKFLKNTCLILAEGNFKKE